MKKMTRLAAGENPALVLDLFSYNAHRTVEVINQVILGQLFSDKSLVRTVEGVSEGKVKMRYWNFLCRYEGAPYDLKVEVPSSRQNPITLRITSCSSAELPKTLITHVQEAFHEYQESATASP